MRFFKLYCFRNKESAIVHAFSTPFLKNHCQLGQMSAHPWKQQAGHTVLILRCTRSSKDLGSNGSGLTQGSSQVSIAQDDLKTKFSILLLSVNNRVQICHSFPIGWLSKNNSPNLNQVRGQHYDDNIFVHPTVWFHSHLQYGQHGVGYH